MNYEEDLKDLFNCMYVKKLKVSIPTPFYISRSNCEYRNEPFITFVDKNYTKFKIFILFKGDLIIHENNKQIPMERNKAYLFFPNQSHKYENINENEICCMWVEFIANAAHDTFSLFSKNDIKILDENYTEELVCKLANILRYLKQNDDENPYELSKISYSFFMDLCYKVQQNIETNLPQEILKIIDYINSNYKDNIVISDVARHLNKSESYVSKIIAKHLNCSVRQYILTKRLDNAIFMLKSSDKSYDEIAELSGFYDSSHMYKMFVKNLGDVPKSFRKI